MTSRQLNLELKQLTKQNRLIRCKLENLEGWLRNNDQHIRILEQTGRLVKEKTEHSF